MKNIIKRVLVLMTVLVLGTALFAGCQSNEGKVRISIAQIADHPSLDTIRDSIIAQLEAQGYKDGENCVIVAKSAQGEVSNLNTIIDNFAANKSDIIIAIATPTAMQALNVAEQPVAQPVQNALAGL